MQGDVRQERTGWRDGGISERHRGWGFNCPAVDIDFLLAEYDSCVVKALIEYKHARAAPADPSGPSYIAISWLATAAGIPFFDVVYADDYSTFTVRRINDVAKRMIGRDFSYTEAEYIRFLYKIRGRVKMI